MSVQKFSVIGHPIGHTMSPFIHNALFALSGKRVEYSVMDIAPENMQQDYAVLRQISGYNITIPHKQAIIPYLDELDESAERYGAVNCVSNGEKAVGYNTDAYGFLMALETADIPLRGEVLICGCGGVARTMAFESLLAGCSLTFAVLESDMPAAQKLKAELLEKLPESKIEIGLIGTFVKVCDLLINATPVGMYPKVDAMPVNEEQLRVTKSVFDAVYNPRKTMLIKKAEENGIPHGEGMAMLVRQAAKAHIIWYGAKFTNEQIAEVIDASYKEMERLFGK